VELYLQRLPDVTKKVNYGHNNKKRQFLPLLSSLSPPSPTKKTTNNTGFLPRLLKRSFPGIAATSGLRDLYPLTHLLLAVGPV